MWLIATPWTAAHQASLPFCLPELAQTHVHWVSKSMNLRTVYPLPWTSVSDRLSLSGLRDSVQIIWSACLSNEGMIQHAGKIMEQRMTNVKHSRTSLSNHCWPQRTCEYVCKSVCIYIYIYMTNDVIMRASFLMLDWEVINNKKMLG